MENNNNIFRFIYTFIGFFFIYIALKGNISFDQFIYITIGGSILMTASTLFPYNFE